MEKKRYTLYQNNYETIFVQHETCIYDFDGLILAEPPSFDCTQCSAVLPNPELLKMHMVTHQKRHGAPESSDRSPNRSMSESYSVQGSSSALLHGNDSKKSRTLECSPDLEFLPKDFSRYLWIQIPTFYSLTPQPLITQQSMQGQLPKYLIFNSACGIFPGFSLAINIWFYHQN